MTFGLVVGVSVPLVGAPEASAPILPPASTGNMYVSSFGTHEVHCFSPDGRFLFKFSHPELIQPRGLVFSLAGDLHAASQAQHKILVFRDDGTYQRQYTGGDLRSPTSIARAPDGSLYVASFGNHNVLVFQGEVFQRSFTAAGLRGPNCIAFAASGDIYVASQLSNEVYRFEADGTPIESFSGGGLSSPMGVAVYGDEVFVTGGASHSVVVFDLQGEHVRTVEGSFEHPSLSGAQGVAFDALGNFAVTSFYKGRAGLFAHDGTELFLFEDSAMRTARSIAFQQRGIEDVFVRGDFNEDATFDIGDAVSILFHLFQAPRETPCRDAGDANDDGEMTITDAIFILEHLFQGGSSLHSPHPFPGTDPSADSLTCR